MSFGALLSQIPINHAAGRVPWVHSWGALNLNNQTDGSLFPFVSESAGLSAASAPLANIPFPARGGEITYLAVLFRTVAVGVATDWNLVLDNVNQAYTVNVAAAGLSAIIQQRFVIAPGAIRLIRPRFTAAVAPGAATTRPAVIIGGWAHQ